MVLAAFHEEAEVTMRRNISYLIVVTVITLALAVSISPVVTSPTGNCSECHSGGQPIGAYTFLNPSLSISTPQSVPPNSSFTVKVSVSSPGKYAMLNQSTSISVSGGAQLATEESANKSIPNIPPAGGTSILIVYYEGRSGPAKWLAIVSCILVVVTASTSFIITGLHSFA
jgi:hypothetical protein